jgi:hypothetical protein
MPYKYEDQGSMTPEQVDGVRDDYIAQGVACTVSR